MSLFLYFLHFKKCWVNVVCSLCDLQLLEHHCHQPPRWF